MITACLWPAVNADLGVLLPLGDVFVVSVTYPNDFWLGSIYPNTALPLSSCGFLRKLTSITYFSLLLHIQNWAFVQGDSDVTCWAEAQPATFDVWMIGWELMLIKWCYAWSTATEPNACFRIFQFGHLLLVQTVTTPMGVVAGPMGLLVSKLDSPVTCVYYAVFSRIFRYLAYNTHILTYDEDYYFQKYLDVLASFAL